MGLGILLSLLLTACLSTLSVNINLEPDGSGEVGFSVIFDGATLSKYPQLLDSIELKDLEAGGWQIVQTNDSLEAGRKISVVKKFFNESQVQIVLDEISPGAFNIDAQRSNANGKNEIIIDGTLDIPRFKNNLLADSNIDLAKLPPKASQIQISTQLGTANDFTTKNWQVSLTSNKTLNFDHTYSIGKNTNRRWLWVSIAAFSLLGLAIAINFLGWIYQKRQKNYSDLKPSAKPKK